MVEPREAANERQEANRGNLECRKSRKGDEKEEEEAKIAVAKAVIPTSPMELWLKVIVCR